VAVLIATVLSALELLYTSVCMIDALEIRSFAVLCAIFTDCLAIAEEKETVTLVRESWEVPASMYCQMASQSYLLCGKQVLGN